MNEIEEITPQPAKSSNKKAAIIIAAVAVLVIIAISAALFYNTQYGPCGKKVVKESVTTLFNGLSNFNDALSIAKRTPRLGLAGPVSDLQDAKSVMEEIEVPLCLEYAKFKLVEGCKWSIQSFYDFMEQQSDTTIDKDLTLATARFNEYNDEVERILECMPSCELKTAR